MSLADLFPTTMVTRFNMSSAELFQSIQASEFSSALGRAPLVYGVFAQLFHIAGLLFILTPSLLISFRLLGNNFLHASASDLRLGSRTLVLTGLLFTILSGLFMLLPSAALYEPNPVFWLKMKLFIAALGVHFLFLTPMLQESREKTFLAKAIAIFSLLLWFAVGAAGRAIGFFAA